MNPPVSQGPDYDRGYADGYRASRIDKIVADLAQIHNIKSEDLHYLKTVVNLYEDAVSRPESA